METPRPDALLLLGLTFEPLETVSLRYALSFSPRYDHANVMNVDRVGPTPRRSGLNTWDINWTRQATIF